MGFEEELQKFKESESPEDVIPLLENPSLQKIAIAWSKIAIRIRPTKKPCPNEKNEIWEWLWDQIDYDPKQITEITGIKYDLMRLTKILIGCRIIYPDGTISSFATKALQQIMLSRLKVKSKRKED